MNPRRGPLQCRARVQLIWIFMKMASFPSLQTSDRWFDFPVELVPPFDVDSRAETGERRKRFSPRLSWKRIEQVFHADHQEGSAFAIVRSVSARWWAFMEICSDKSEFPYENVSTFNPPRFSRWKLLGKERFGRWLSYVSPLQHESSCVCCVLNFFPRVSFYSSI